MKLLGATLVALLLASCTSAAAGTPGGGVAGSAARTSAGGPSAAGAVTILVSEGGLLRPVDNGGRVALHEGWATIRVSPVPLRERTELDVGVFDGSGRAVAGRVDVTYESIDMDHGRTTVTGIPDDGGYHVPLELIMPGAWRLVVEIARGGTADTVTLVLPEVGY